VEMLNSLNLLSMESRRKIIKPPLLYKIANNLAAFTEDPFTSCVFWYLYSARYVPELSFYNLYGYASECLYSYFPKTIELLCME